MGGIARSWRNGHRERGARTRSGRRRRMPDQMGAKITGAGTSSIVVEGVSRLKAPVIRAAGPHRDRYHAMAVAMTGGDVLLEAHGPNCCNPHSTRCHRRAARFLRPMRASALRAMAVASVRSRSRRSRIQVFRPICRHN